MSARGIRSSAHRQVLTWLRHGPATVSEIAKQFDMRMPHASLACRQLRADGLIVRDETGGLRNAPMYLSQRGVERLHQDALAKLRHYADRFDRQGEHCVLQADATNVLLGYVESPESPLIFIPSTTDGSQPTSSGNAGGVWVLLESEQTVWIDLTDFSATTPPAAPQGVTLQDFHQRPQKVGLIRGEIFESTAHSGLIEGHRFTTLSEMEVPPLRLREGEVPIGTVVGTDHAYFPPRGMVAHLPSSVDRALLLDALSQHAVHFSDREGLRRRTLPVGVLRAWLAMKHSRMSEEKIHLAHQDLVTSLQQTSTSIAPSLRRELATDFGEVEWSEEDWKVGLIDIYGMSHRGLEAVLTHLVESTTLPFSVDWPFEDAAFRMQTNMDEHPLCQVWITRKGGDDRLTSVNRFSPTPEVATIHVHLGRTTVLPVRLGSSSSMFAEQQRLDRVPANAVELLEGHRLRGNEGYSRPCPDGPEGVRMNTALRFFPVGDEPSANAWEAEDALASWIASPQDQRPARWIRLHSRLPKGWTDLMEVASTPPSHFVQAMAKANPDWLMHAFHRLRTDLLATPSLMLDLVNGLSDPELGSWCATALLCGLDPVATEHASVIEQATQRWFQQPICEQHVLEQMFSSQTLGSAHDEARLSSWLAFARQQPKSTLLSHWAEAVEVARSNEPWLPERQRVFMQRLPAEWWSCYAEGWLTTQLNSASGRMWLKEHELNWLAQLTLPAGWVTGLPGAQRPHPGHSLTSDMLIGVKLLGDGPGVTNLNDTYEAVYAMEQGLPPPPLEVHPYGGWMVHPVDRWPRFDAAVLEVGDTRIGHLLFAIGFASRLQE